MSRLVASFFMTTTMPKRCFRNISIHSKPLEAVHALNHFNLVYGQSSKIERFPVSNYFADRECLVLSLPADLEALPNTVFS